MTEADLTRARVGPRAIQLLMAGADATDEWRYCVIVMHGIADYGGDVYIDRSLVASDV